MTMMEALLSEHGSVSGLQVHIALGQLGNIDDGGVTEGAVAIHQRGAADQTGICQSLLGGLASDIQNQVLVAGGFQLLNGVVQVGDVLSPHAQGHACLGGSCVHSFPVVGSCAVQDHILAGDSQSSLGALHIPALQDPSAAGCGSLLHQLCVDSGIVLGVGAQNELHIHSLADTLVVDLGHFSQLGVHFLVAHAGADGNRVQVLIDQSLLMTEQDCLAAQLMFTHRDGLHGRRRGLGEHRLCFFGEIGTLGDGHGALGHLHAECHTGGAAALLTVLLRRQLKNIKTL